MTDTTKVVSNINLFSRLIPIMKLDIIDYLIDKGICEETELVDNINHEINNDHGILDLYLRALLAFYSNNGLNIEEYSIKSILDKFHGCYDTELEFIEDYLEQFGVMNQLENIVIPLPPYQTNSDRLHLTIDNLDINYLMQTLTNGNYFLSIMFEKNNTFYMGDYKYYIFNMYK